MYGYIYKTTDLFTSKIYVGKKTSKKFNPNYYGSGTIIYRIKLKCISNNIDLNFRFTVHIIDVAYSKDELDLKEKFWIDFLDSRNPEIGYNLRAGGDCGPGGPMFKNHFHSIETHLKMSEDRKGKKNSNYGNRWKQTDALRYLHSKLSTGESNGMFGKKHSKESNNKNAQSHLSKVAISSLELHKCIMINKDELDTYLSKGWIKGNLNKKVIK